MTDVEEADLGNKDGVHYETVISALAGYGAFLVTFDPFICYINMTRFVVRIL